MLDPVSINGQLWNVRGKKSDRNGLFLQLAPERRADMSPEQLREERNKDKEQMKSRRSVREEKKEYRLDLEFN